MILFLILYFYIFIGVYEYVAIKKKKLSRKEFIAIFWVDSLIKHNRMHKRNYTETDIHTF